MRKEKSSKTTEESFLYRLSIAPQESSSETIFADYFGERQKTKAAEKISLKRLKESAVRIRFRLGGGRREII